MARGIGIGILGLALVACAHASPRRATAPGGQELTSAQCAQIFGREAIPPTLVDLAAWSLARNVPTDCGGEHVVERGAHEGTCTAGPVAVDGGTTKLAIDVRSIDGELYVVRVSKLSE